MNFQKQILDEGFSVFLNWSKITLAGPDAKAYLGRQSTNNVKTLNKNQFQLNTFLEADGKIVSYFLLVQESQQLSIYVPPEIAETTFNHIEKYHIIEDFEASAPTQSKVYLNFSSKLNDRSSIGEFFGIVSSLDSQPYADLLQDENQKLFFSLIGCNFNYIGKLLTSSLLSQYALDTSKGCYPGQEPISKILNNRGAAYYPALIKTKEHLSFLENKITYQEKTIARNIEPFQYQKNYYLSVELLRDFRIQHRNLTLNNNGDIGEVLLFPLSDFSSDQFVKNLFQQATQKVLEENIEDAKELLETILLINPNFEDALEIYGVLEAKQSNFKSAISWMQRLSEVNPVSIMAQTNMSLYYMKIGEIELAEKHKEEATFLSFKSMAPKVDQQLEEQKRKLNMFNKVIEIDNDDTMANAGIGQIYFEQNKVNEAIPYLQKVLKIDPKYSQAYLYLGKCYTALNEQQKAIEIYKKGINIAAQKGELMPANEMEILLKSLN